MAAIFMFPWQPRHTHLMLFLFQGQLILQPLHQILHRGRWSSVILLFDRLDLLVENLDISLLLLDDFP